LKDKFKMLIEVNITDKNIMKVEEIMQQLLNNSAISVLDYSNVLTASMCIRALNVKQEDLPDNVIAFEPRKAR
jgi:hypothetical protein